MSRAHKCSLSDRTPLLARDDLLKTGPGVFGVEKSTSLGRSLASTSAQVAWGVSSTSLGCGFTSELAESLA